MTEIKKTPSQQAAIDSRDKNIIVSAAAGSGKTFVLVERVISLMVEESIDIDKMIIVTFTNKAAADMKAKIRDRLEERKDEFDYPFYKRQLKLLNKAQIKTLHSFCADMIRENFYYFDDLSPNFKVITDSTNTILKMETIDEIFDREYEEMTEGFRVFLQNFGTNADDLPAKSVIIDTYEKIIGQVDPIGWLEAKTEEENSLAKLKEIADKTLRGLLDLSFRLTVYANEKDMREKHQELATQDYQLIRDLYENLKPWDDFIKKIDGTSFPRLSWSKNDDQEAYTRLKTTRNFYKNKVKSLADLVRNSEEDLASLTSKKENLLLSEIERLTKKFYKLFSAKKRDRSYLDFSDMEHYFIKLLDDETARAKLRENFTYIFFDEYQDSNEVQNHIIERLKRPSNLFFVGDVKQSIYGFRRARPDLFLDKLEDYSKDKDSLRIDLNENFRTDKLILDFNNYIFDRLMTKEVSDIDYRDGGHRLNFGKEEENPKSRVGIRILDKDVSEEDYLVKLINELVADGYDYRDIAILLRSGGKSYAYEESLKMAGIPYFNDISKVSFRAAEVGFFINLLRLLANPNDDLSLLAVLRSEIFGFNEDDLAAIKLASKSFRFYEGFRTYDGDPKLVEKIDSFKATIKDLKGKLAILNLYDFANYLFESTGLYDFLLARDLGEDRINNIESLIDLMAEYDRANDNGLYGFLSFYENISKNQKDTIDQSRDLSEDENLVRMMTIHKSKGLEFKVVILADASRTIRDMHSRNNIVFDDELGIGIDIANYEEKVKVSSLNKKLIQNKLKEEDKKEEMRILYVALTRAEDRLYITGNKASKPAKELYQNTDYMSMSSHLDWLISTLSFDKITEDLFEKDYLTNHFSDRVRVDFIEEIESVEASQPRDLKDILEKEADGENIRTFEKYLDYDYEGADDIGRSLKKSVTEIAKNFDRQNEGYEESSFGQVFRTDELKKPDFLIEEKQYSALDRGTLIHKVFERLPLKVYDLDSINEEIKGLAADNIISKDSLAILESDKFLAFYENQKIKDLIEKKAPFRKEESFLMAYEDFYVNGQIDLIFEEDDGIVLIDFKTDRQRRDYSDQLKIYALAIEEALDKPVKKKLIYWYNFKVFEEL